MAVRRSSQGDMSAFSLHCHKAVAPMGSNDLDWEAGNLNYGQRIVDRKFETLNLCGGKTLNECSMNYGFFRK
jgi:hypothetical protein